MFNSNHIIFKMNSIEFVEFVEFVNLIIIQNFFGILFDYSLSKSMGELHK